jgi:hypothetical protein
MSSTFEASSSPSPSGSFASSAPASSATASTASTFSPQERLANSRREIIRHMSRDSKPADESDSPNDDDPYEQRTSSSNPSSTWNVVKRAVLTWWNHHPVSVAFDLARPVVGHYAEGKPFKLLGIAAGIGAAAVLLRPWRLVSLGGVLLTALKSSELSSVFHSVISNSRQAPSRSGENQ